MGPAGPIAVNGGHPPRNFTGAWRECRTEWARICLITAGPSMLAHTLSAPPQSAQVKMSILNTRFNRCAHVIETWRAGAGVQGRHLDLRGLWWCAQGVSEHRRSSRDQTDPGPSRPARRARDTSRCIDSKLRLAINYLDRRAAPATPVFRPFTHGPPLAVDQA